MTKKMFGEFSPATKADWIEKARKSITDPQELKKLLFETEDGFTLAALYALEDLNNPEKSSFVKSTTNHSSKIRQRIFVDKYMEANQFVLDAIQGGADEVELWGDDFGNENEFRQLINGIDFSRTPVHFQFGESNRVLVFVLMEELLKIEKDAQEFKGSVALDPLNELLLTGNFDYPYEEVFKALAVLIEQGSAALPSFQWLQVNAGSLGNAGAADAMELGFAFSMITEYLHQLSEKGLVPENLISKMQISLSAGADYFSTLAKIRAFRLMWSSLAEAFHLKNEMPHLNICASDYNYTIYDAHNNLLRATAQAMSAFAGSCDSFTFLPFDATFKKPDSFSYRISRNIGNILRFESAIMNVDDPAAGSYFIENYTTKMAETAWYYFVECEKRGGFIESLKQKYIQGLIEQNAQKKSDDFANSKLVLTGTNKYLNPAESMKDKFSLNFERPAFKDEFLVMPLRPKRLSQKLDEARLKRDGIQFSVPENQSPAELN